ncbi:hypothetical protein F5Y19DRAFT_332055 [Xylariaceae sp. FL1651]|nr:hypothetical protein F5Y19DRAFT_332055 [Xylariaceae sp. FL1651]
MRRRNSTNPRRLDRRKSTTSVKSVQLEHILPETAERDAQVAATQAFARAKERSATDSTLWPPSRCDGPGSSTLGSHPWSQSRTRETPLRNQQSIRFVPSRPYQLTPSSTTTQDLTVSSIPYSSKLQITEIDVEPRPPSSASASGMVSAAKGAAGDYINSLFTCNEYYTPEDDIASAPSSFRRLRKSKSMFASKAADAGLQHPKLSKSSASATQLPLPTGFPLQHNENVPPLGLKAPKSMSILQDFRGNFNPVIKIDNHATSVLSTGGYMDKQDTTGVDFCAKSSRFFRSKPSNHKRAFRKSMRNTSNSTISTYRENSKENSLRTKARKVSQGFKHKLRNLFSLTKADSDVVILPPQHIEAQMSHVADIDGLEHGFDNELAPLSSIDQGSLSHVASGVPSLHTVPSYQQPRSRQGSMESLRSEQKASDERSRVTSWSNSDTNTIVTVNSYRDERERKRLSIIKENGAHVCSSSMPTVTLSNQSNESVTSLPELLLPQPLAVDGRRIYSALMKRMDQTQQTHAGDLKRQRSIDDFVRTGSVPQRKSSLRLRRPGCGTFTTIRHVVSDVESDTVSTKANDGELMTHKWNSTVQISSSSPSADIEPSEERPRLLISTFTDLTTEDVSSNGTVNDAANKFLLAPPTEEEPALTRTLSSRSSAFFGSPTCHLFRTQSPYRRVLQDRMRTAPDELPIRSPETNPWMCSLSNLPMRCPSTCESDADIKMYYTESIYSSNTDDYSTGTRNFQSLVDDFPGPPSAHGDVTIFVNPPSYKQNSSVPPKQRVSSSSSSVEWKMWLSSNISKIEESTTNVDTDDFKYSIPSARSSGHIQENAQINGEDDDPIPNPHSMLSANVSNPSGPHQDNGEDKTTPFDTGVEHSMTIPSQILPVKTLPTSISASSIVEHSNAFSKRTTTRLSNEVREKPLSRVPSLNLAESLSAGQANMTNMTTKLITRQPKSKNRLISLEGRSLLDAVDPQPRKAGSLAGSQQKIDRVASAKTENVIPAAASDEDLYGIEGAGTLGPNLQTTGSKRMVDIFLSSRRRRLASSDDGSVFL